MEQVFDKAFFIDAFNSIFNDLGPAQAMFGAASESPNVSALLDAASSIVAFDMSFSTGIKVQNALSVFTGGVDATASLFFRLNDLGVFAEATIVSADLDIFPGVIVEGGDFLLSAGVRITSPFEGEVTVGGNMASGINFSHSLTTIAFTPHGKLKASLPFEVTINGLTQGLVIKFEDDNLFDTINFLVKVDFPVCPTISNELFHLCAEAAETGDVGPLLEDVITMIKEDVLDFVDFDNLFTAEGCTTGRRHRALREAGIHRATTSHAIFKRTAGDHRGRRALRKTHPSACSPRAGRARHLPYNHFTRPPRRRRLQTECPSIELLDGISIIGGYDGIQIFLKLELDVSKEDKEDLREVILKPLELLNEAEFLRELNLFGD
eukprot:scaffold102673_cov71-Cyclotella_meneghiniana.AAC.1